MRPAPPQFGAPQQIGQWPHPSIPVFSPNAPSNTRYAPRMHYARPPSPVPPRRPKRGFLAITLVGGVLLGLTSFGSVLADAVRGPATYRSPRATSSRATITTPTLPTVAIPTTSKTSAASTKTYTPATKKASTAPATRKTTTAPVPPVALPPIPYPSTKSAATTAVKNNAFYRQKVGATTCGVKNLNPRTATAAQTQTYLTQVLDCLNRAWAAPVKSAGWSLPKTTVTVYTMQIRTKCGVANTRNAFYCSADQQLFFAHDLQTVVSTKYRSHRLLLDFVLAHEFGHFLQGRTSILGGQRIQAQSMTAQAAKEHSRRLELQADCLSGMFMRSMAQSRKISTQEFTDIGAIAYGLGDDVLSGDPNIWAGHGKGSSRRAWTAQGSAGTTLSACKTFTASAASVR